MSIIEIKDFSKKYGRFLAVDKLNLTVNKGEIVGFVGKNGAGKSTTIRAIMNMIHPTNGSITVSSMDSIRDSKAIKKHVSYVPSESSFYNNITSEQLLKFCLKFSNQSSDKMYELAEHFELDLKKKVMELSLGNRKKVSLIQAFLKNAELIILDEPTGGLDPLMQSKFFELLLKARDEGATVFLSSHNLSEVERYCDKVAIIKGGKLVDFFDMKDVKVKHKQVVTYTTVDGQNHAYDIEEDINSLLTKLTKLNLTHLEIKTRSVEDEFIGYYKDGEHHE